MIVIKDAQALARALDSPIDPALKRLLITRRDQLLRDTGGDYDIGELAHFIVIEPNDTIGDVEAAACLPIVTSNLFEWVDQHDGWFEAAVILSDDGFGLALLTPDRKDVDPALLTVLRDEAARTATTTVSATNHEHLTAP